MFNLFRKRSVTAMEKLNAAAANGPRVRVRVSSFSPEMLESRRLMSGSHGGGDCGGSGAALSSITFDLAPTSVQTGLSTLATAGGFDAPTSATKVSLGNRNGVETYSIKETGTGTTSTLTVDTTGTAVTAAVKSTTTFGAITNTAVTSEFTAIATAISATAPASADSVTVLTASGGTATYTIGLTTTTSSGKTRTSRYTVDSNGNPTGSERVPLSVLSTAIRNGLTSAAPSGATALTDSSLINVQTVDGVTLYTANYSATGVKTSVTVNTAGVLTSLPSSKSITFADVPSAAKTELQALATAKNVTTTIADTTKVTATTEANGVVLYTIRLIATSTTDSTKTVPVVLTVDAAGNPTVSNGGGGLLEGFGGGRGHGGGKHGGDGGSGGSSSGGGTNA